MIGEPASIEGPIKGERASTISCTILRALPEWFGIEEAVSGYIRDVAALPTWIATRGKEPAGFLTVRQNFPCSAEVYVMGVLPRFQRSGIGRALVACVEECLGLQGVLYLQVKTLAPTHPDPFYARTRAFYEAVGFSPLEIFPQLWNADNPCLVMVKKL